MPLISDSKLNAAFKKLSGKAHSDNAKETSNEAQFSSVTIAGETVFGQTIPGAPSITTLYDITDGVVEFVRLEAVVDPTANGHGFILRLPSTYETFSSHPNAGTGVLLNNQILSDTKGQIQIVPPLFGLSYEAKPYIGGSVTKGSGTLVPPGDARDWILDYFNGIIFQEDDPSNNPPDIEYVECIIYIGDMITEVVSSGGTGTSIADEIITKGGNPNVIGTEVVDSIDITTHSVAKWFVKAHLATECIFMEVSGLYFDGQVKHSFAHMKTIGSPAANFCLFDVDLVGSDMRLLATAGVSNVVVEVVRIQIV